MTKEKHTAETLANIHAGNVIAQKVNDDMLAISSLLAGTAVAYGIDRKGANDVIDAVVETARASLQSGFDYLASKGRKQ
jgi:hypothetical protein